MMSCEQLADLLLRYRDGELGAEETDVLKAHLHKCPPCLDLLGGYEEVVKTLARLQPCCMPDDVLSRVRARLESEGAPE